MLPQQQELCWRHHYDLKRPGVLAVGRYVVLDGGVSKQTDLCLHCAGILNERGLLKGVVRGKSIEEIKSEQERIARATGNVGEGN